MSEVNITGNRRAWAGAFSDYSPTVWGWIRSFARLFDFIFDFVFYPAQERRCSFYVFTEGILCFALQGHGDGHLLRRKVKPQGVHHAYRGTVNGDQFPLVPAENVETVESCPSFSEEVRSVNFFAKAKTLIAVNFGGPYRQVVVGVRPSAHGVGIWGFGSLRSCHDRTDVENLWGLILGENEGR